MNVTEKIKFKVNYLETDVNIILKYEIEFYWKIIWDLQLRNSL